MASLAVKLPITRDSADGFAMIKDFRTLIKQNFKMLLLTNPGERVMEPDFGVGMKRYLFESFETDVYSRIDSKIREQVSRYMPAISITRINFHTIDPEGSRIAFSLEYSIPAIATADLLEFTI